MENAENQWEIQDEYVKRLHKCKLSIILMKKMLRSSLISETEFKDAVNEIKKLYQIKD